MQLDRVTITGADDSIDPEELAKLSVDFPFVEWGLLLSASNSGSARFPSLEWLARFYDVCQSVPGVKLSLHVCGEWVREICAGHWSPVCSNTGPILGLGNTERVQLNFHAYGHLLGLGFFPATKQRCREQSWQVIFQCDGVNDSLLLDAFGEGLDAVPLYDKSGGAGVIPDSWPLAMEGVYSGYAGGLGPDNLESELPGIAEAAGGERFWIDMETKVRSGDDRVFNLDAVRRCLSICQPYVSTA